MKGLEVLLIFRGAWSCTLEARRGKIAAITDPLSCKESPGQHELQQTTESATIARFSDFGLQGVLIIVINSIKDGP